MPVMPVMFDFKNGGTSVSASGAGQQVAVNVADGVRFTVTSDADVDDKAIIFSNNTATTFSAIFLADSRTNDTFDLTFQSTANPSNTRLSGTTGSPIALQLGSLAGSWQIKFLTTGGGSTGTTTLTVTDSNKLVELTANNVTGIRFSTVDGVASGSDLIVKSLSAKEFNCFCAGTRVATAAGHVTVEDLQPGDKILRADGGETEVKWVGRQFIDTRLTHPSIVNPIRICAGALGAGLPERDLLISADHAIWINGLLVNAGALVNGETIFREPEMPRDGFTYYHVETEAHELILAEGLPAESFLDYGRWGFDNADEREGAQVIPEMDIPRISAARLLPAHIREQIAPERVA